MINKNIFNDIPEIKAEEIIETLLESRDIRIERIVSRGHASPTGFWYDQAMNEYVILLKGRAGLLIKGEKNTRIMKPGDYVDIRAHMKHRVEWTDSNQDTVWLAVYYQ